MKRSLWVLSSVAVLALPVGITAARSMAGNGQGSLSGLQHSINASSVEPLPVAGCKLDCKIHQDCSVNYKCEPCNTPGCHG